MDPRPSPSRPEKSKFFQQIKALGEQKPAVPGLIPEGLVRSRFLHTVIICFNNNISVSKTAINVLVLHWGAADIPEERQGLDATVGLSGGRGKDASTKLGQFVKLNLLRYPNIKIVLMADRPSLLTDVERFIYICDQSVKDRAKFVLKGEEKEDQKKAKFIKKAELALHASRAKAAATGSTGPVASAKLSAPAPAASSSFPSPAPSKFVAGLGRTSAPAPAPAPKKNVPGLAAKISVPSVASLDIAKFGLGSIPAKTAPAPSFLAPHCSSATGPDAPSGFSAQAISVTPPSSTTPSSPSIPSVFSAPATSMDLPLFSTLSRSSAPPSSNNSAIPSVSLAPAASSAPPGFSATTLTPKEQAPTSAQVSVSATTANAAPRVSKATDGDDEKKEHPAQSLHASPGSFDGATAEGIAICDDDDDAVLTFNWPPDKPKTEVVPTTDANIVPTTDAKIVPTTDAKIVPTTDAKIV